MNEDELFSTGFTINNIPGKFILVNTEESPLTDDEGFIFGTNFIAGYYNARIDCQVVMTENRLIGEEIEPISVVMNNIDDEIFDYIVGQLRQRKGIRIWAIQHYNELSDVVVVKDYFGESTAISEDLMQSLMIKAKASPYKYIEIQYGMITPIKEVMKCMENKYST